MRGDLGADFRPKVSRVLWVIGRVLAIIPFRLGLRVRLHGRENVPRKGATLFVSNHRSYLDPPLVGFGASPRGLYYMAKHDLFRFPVFGWLIHNLGAFPVVRDTADRNAIRIAQGILDDGHCVLMFPEATRGTAPDGTLLEGKPGAVLLALHPGVTVVPVAVWDPKRRFGPIHVRFGPALDFSDLDGAPRRERTDTTVARIMGAISGLVTESRAAEAARGRGRE